jgi:hypothetical protein
MYLYSILNNIKNGTVGSVCISINDFDYSDKIILNGYGVKIENSYYIITKQAAENISNSLRNKYKNQYISENRLG